MRYQLTIVKGPFRGKVFPVPEAGLLTIGRGADCGIALDDLALSVYHCGIEFRDGEPWVVDLGSDHGMPVNGKIVKELRVGPNDLVEAGSSTFKVVPVKPKAKLGQSSTSAPLVPMPKRRKP